MLDWNRTKAEYKHIYHTCCRHISKLQILYYTFSNIRLDVTFVKHRRHTSHCVSCSPQSDQNCTHSFPQRVKVVPAGATEAMTMECKSVSGVRGEGRREGGVFWVWGGGDEGWNWSQPVSCVSVQLLSGECLHISAFSVSCVLISILSHLLLCETGYLRGVLLWFGDFGIFLDVCQLKCCHLIQWLFMLQSV